MSYAKLQGFWPECFRLTGNLLSRAALISRRRSSPTYPYCRFPEWVNNFASGNATVAPPEKKREASTPKKEDSKCAMITHLLSHCFCQAFFLEVLFPDAPFFFRA
jgi:hypothetical protein